MQFVFFLYGISEPPSRFLFSPKLKFIQFKFNFNFKLKFVCFKVFFFWFSEMKSTPRNKRPFFFRKFVIWNSFYFKRGIKKNYLFSMPKETKQKRNEENVWNFCIMIDIASEHHQQKHLPHIYCHFSSLFGVCVCFFYDVFW